MQHHGKVALVTGAGQGIGLACAERLLRDGARVVLLDRNAVVAAEQAGRLGPDALAMEVDLLGLGPEAAAGVVERVSGIFGGIDILVNNAGLVATRPFLQLDPAEFDRAMDVNVRAPLVLSQAAARAMIAAGKGGAIVNITSVTAELAQPGLAAYASSKAALRQLTRVMALELIDHGIRVNAVGPGTIGTEMAAKVVQSDPAVTAAMMSRTPARRLGKPEEIAAAVSFLASDDAGYIVGQTIYVDGGRLVLNYTVPAQPQ
ncbi:SDR family NAD(P)-dependent oxidoreductase [Aquibium microcysteis]|uniref:SDR family NAD(P)-dependent oxidoreductase n=1 Tax=Aquibium microcysteis TaxID=675281 RepID=UPI00165D1459|nr:glucose 1-dehydrogenase [Aquibium microcysteis]